MEHSQSLSVCFKVQSTPLDSMRKQAGGWSTRTRSLPGRLKRCRCRDDPWDELIRFRFSAALLVVHGWMVWTLMPIFPPSWHISEATRIQSLTPLGSLINFASLPTEWRCKLNNPRQLSWTGQVLRDAISRVQTLALSNMAQATFMPHFHPVGFQKVSIPREMYARILTGRKKALSGKR